MIRREVQSGMIYYTYFRKGKRKKFRTGVKESQKRRRENIKILSGIEGKLTTIINTYRTKYGENPSVEHVTQMYLRDIPTDSDTLLGYLEAFLKQKNGEVKKQSYKDYVSMRNSVTDYIDHKGGDIPLDELSKTDIVNFNKYLGEVRKINDKTNRKRIACLKEYLRWVRTNEIFAVPESVIKTKIQSGDYLTTKVTLEPEELQQLKEYEFPEEHYNKVKDAFIFMCATSFRYSDLVTFNKAHVKGDVIEKVAVKTMKGNASYTLPVTPTMKALMDKYDYDFNFYTNQAFNRYLKELLKEYSEKTGRLKGKVNIKKVVLGKETFEKKEKWDCISSSTGRRTFITLALENGVAPNKIINMTAHKRITTLNQYINPKTKTPDVAKISFV